MGECRMPDQAVLMVPVHLDALVLTEDRAVVDTLADFTRMPHFDGMRDVHSDVGYLSEAILSSPFANQNLRLPAGIHLRWALPDALTRAQAGDALSFPAVPNRWLVLRGRDGADEAYERAWVVQSDYLHPPGAGAETGSAAYPLDAASAGTSPPYRYLGRVVDLGEEPASDPDSAWLPGLTAVGYGDPLFAAFYPNCRNVFGLHDDGADARPGLRYDVIGWHEDGREYLATLLRTAPDKDPREALRRLAGWAVPDDGTPVPERTLYYARLTFADEPDPVVAAGPPVTVAVGNTGWQALGAYLADTLGAPAAPTVEDQLAAILLASQVNLSGPDAGAAFAAAVHESGFVAGAAGTLWTVRRPGDGSGTTADSTRTDRQNALVRRIPDELTPIVDRLNHAVNALNAAQQAYDRATDEICALCDQLFADWYRYMLCAYPPTGSGEDYPAIDDVRRFIERHDLAELRRRVAATGQVELSATDGGDAWPVAVDADPGSTASAVARAAADAKAALDALNGSPAFTAAGLAFRVQRVEAPRYWEPAEPVVLLAGDGMAATLRHGQDGRLRPDGLLDCPVADRAPLPPRTRDDADELVGLLDGLAPAAGQSRIGFQTWDPQAWDPLLLAWEAEILPAGPATAYPADFLRRTYTLAENEPELHWRDGQGQVRTAASVYSGTTVLTPHAHELHLRRLSGYVMGVYERDQGRPPMSDVDATAYLADDGHLQELIKWYDGKRQKADGHPDPVGVALQALSRLRRTPSLAQSLGGFNEALLARRQTLQFDVADPLGFDDYRRFTDDVRQFVQGPAGTVPPYLRGHNRSAPQPAAEYQPLRAGALRLRRLRLLDAFGRVRDLRWNRVVAARSMPVAAGSDLVTLPPRIVQPARLSFRWLSADAGDQQLTELATETPICGWVVVNHLDESLMIHAADGTALGALDRNGQWQSAPGGTTVTHEQITDLHLRQLVTHLLAQGGAALAALHGALDSALENVDPAGVAVTDGVAVLVGRPLAVVRAAVNLELRGLAAVGQSWADLRADLARTTRTTDGFEAVRVPVRLGDYRRLGDGLVGFWRESGDGYLDVFYAPLSEPVDDPAIRTHTDEEAPFDLSLTGPSEVVTMLVDPRGAVNATCGVLPVKTISIPTEQYVDALSRIEVTFVAGPLLAPDAVLDLPLLDEPGASWAWVERVATGWQETRSTPTVDRPAFQQTLVLLLWQRLLTPEVRWLRPLDEQSAQAEVVSPVERAGPPGTYASAVDAILPAPGTALSLADFAAAATTAIAGPAWGRLAAPDAGWLAPLDGGDGARVVLDSRATATLPAPLTGLEQLIRSTFDLCRRRLVPPDSDGITGPRQLREGWLKLSRSAATT
jgi:hypothetical protein